MNAEEPPTKRVKLNDALQCGICCDVFVQPTTLPCGHTYCRAECMQWTPPTCPTCRTPYVKNALKDNIALCGLIADMPMTCAECGEVVARGVYTEHCRTKHVKVLTPVTQPTTAPAPRRPIGSFSVLRPRPGTVAIVPSPALRARLTQDVERNRGHGMPDPLLYTKDGHAFSSEWRIATIADVRRLTVRVVGNIVDTPLETVLGQFCASEMNIVLIPVLPRHAPSSDRRVFLPYYNGGASEWRDLCMLCFALGFATASIHFVGNSHLKRISSLSRGVTSRVALPVVLYDHGPLQNRQRIAGILSRQGSNQGAFGRFTYNWVRRMALTTLTPLVPQQSILVHDENNRVETVYEVST